MDLDKLYREYFGSVYRYILAICKDRHLAEEITQETFFRAVKKIDTFRGESNIRVWLCQIAKNQYFTHIRKSKRIDSLDASDLKELIDDGVEEFILNKEASGEARRAIHQLEEPYKEVFMLRVYAEMSFREIGALFDKSEGWTRVTYHRSRLKILDNLEGRYENKL